MPTDSPASTASAPRFITYLRVSTAKQGASGLGLEAQREAVAKYLRQRGAAVPIAEYLEVESGRRADRPELARAMRHARNAGATLVIAKLDRLSRDVHFLTGLEKAGVDFVACDLPQANRLTITILGAVAEYEAKLIAERTKAALTVAKGRVKETGQAGHPEVKRLGNPYGAGHLKGLGNAEAVEAIKAKADAKAEGLREDLEDIRRAGITSARGIARALNERHIRTPRGASWDAKAVTRLAARLDAAGQ